MISVSHLDQLFASHNQAYMLQPNEPLESRLQNLLSLERSIKESRQELIRAVSIDFGGRSENETDIAEIHVCLEAIKYTTKRLSKWMAPSKRKVGMAYWPASNRVEYQPLGVVGIMSPWNYPIQLSLVPLIYALAAGNRAIIKPSELTPETNKILQKMIEKAFEPDRVSIVEGDAELASYFSSLPWDHLVFTGSTSIGKHVMAAAAKNLTPVTLELGGKSPALVCDDFDIKTAAERICFGKSVNSGQTCVAPDYALVPRDKVDQFQNAMMLAFREMYPCVADNSDYTAIISTAHKERLENLIEDAQAKGAKVLALNSESEDLTDSGKLALHLVTETDEGMLLMQEEIFGPILPIVAYDSFTDALRYINERPRPLALYCFSDEKPVQRSVLDGTHSGGVCLNDTLFHLIQDDLPFGGIGESGMGHYHGHEGFLSLSKAKAVHSKGRFCTSRFYHPPLDSMIKRALKKLFF